MEVKKEPLTDQLTQIRSDIRKNTNFTPATKNWLINRISKYINSPDVEKAITDDCVYINKEINILKHSYNAPQAEKNTLAYLYHLKTLLANIPECKEEPAANFDTTCIKCGRKRLRT